MRAETALACDRKIISTQAWDLMDEERSTTQDHTSLGTHSSVACMLRWQVSHSLLALVELVLPLPSASAGFLSTPAQDTLRFAANTKTPGSASHRRVYALISRNR